MVDHRLDTPVVRVCKNPFLVDILALNSGFWRVSYTSLPGKSRQYVSSPWHVQGPGGTKKNHILSVGAFHVTGSERQALFLSSIDQLQKLNIEDGILKATDQKHIHVDAWWDFQMKVGDNFLKTTALPHAMRINRDDV